MNPYITAFLSAIAITGLSLAIIASISWFVAKTACGTCGHDLEPVVIGGAISGMIGGLGVGCLVGYWIYFRILTIMTG